LTPLGRVESKKIGDDEQGKQGEGERGATEKKGGEAKGPRDATDGNIKRKKWRRTPSKRAKEQQ